MPMQVRARYDLQGCLTMLVCSSSTVARVEACDVIRGRVVLQISNATNSCIAIDGYKCTWQARANMRSSRLEGSGSQWERADYRESGGIREEVCLLLGQRWFNTPLLM